MGEMSAELKNSKLKTQKVAVCYKYISRSLLEAMIRTVKNAIVSRVWVHLSIVELDGIRQLRAQSRQPRFLRLT